MHSAIEEHSESKATWHAACCPAPWKQGGSEASETCRDFDAEGPVIVLVHAHFGHRGG